MEDVRKTYDFYMEKYRKQWAEVKRTMEMLNLMADDLEIERPFPKIEDENQATGKPKLRDDQFVGKALSPAVEEYLSLRGKEIGARPWPEIVQALRNGGFENLGKTKSAEDRARNTILKATMTFKLVGKNSFGLVVWYPKLKKEKTKEDEAQEQAPEEKRGRGRPKKIRETENQSQDHTGSEKTA